MDKDPILANSRAGGAFQAFMVFALLAGAAILALWRIAVTAPGANPPPSAATTAPAAQAPQNPESEPAEADEPETPPPPPEKKPAESAAATGNVDGYLAARIGKTIPFIHKGRVRDVTLVAFTSDDITIKAKKTVAIKRAGISAEQLQLWK